MKLNGGKILASVVLLTWGSVLCYFFFSGRLASYLHPAFHIYTAVSGVVLVLMAFALLFWPEPVEGEESEHSHHEEAHDAHAHHGECCGHAHHDHDHHHHGHLHDHSDCCDHETFPVSPRSYFLAAVLIVPLLMATVYSPSQFSAVAVMNRGIINSITDLPIARTPRPMEPALPSAEGWAGVEESPVDLGSYLQKNAQGQIVAQTIDLLFAAEEPTIRSDFEGKEIEVIGQFMPAKMNNATGDRFNLVRMFMVCCAADARPIAVPVQLSSNESFPDMTWVKVTGKALFPVEGGRRVALIKADAVQETEPPEESLLY